MKIPITSAIAALFMALPLASQAVVVHSAFDQVDNTTTWTVDFTLVNDGSPTEITGFTVYFPQGRYTNMLISNSPVGWDSLLVAPDAGLPAPGFLDSFKIDPTSPLTLGQSLGDFQVRFRLVGPGSPTALAFSINDPAFNVVASGLTTVSLVPEPAAAMLLALGLCGVALGARTKLSASSAV